MEAFEWFYRSAMQGNKCAQHNLIYCYAHGVGVLKDLEMASVWYDVEKNQPANEKPILKLTSSEVESLNKIRHNERLKFINENISENILNSTINLDDNVSSKYKITTNKKMKLINATNCLNEVNVDWLPEVATNEYLFISYSHADYKKVYQDIFSFQVYGKSVWYDRAMPPSQNWEETAEMYIYKFSCKGIVFYISLNSIISASIHKEIECAMKHGKSILVISLPINEHYFYNGEDMYGKEVSPYKMIEVLKDNGHEISQDKEDFIFKYFNDKVIYVPYSSKIDKKIEEISKLKKPKLFVIDDFGPEVEIAKVNDSDIKRVRESDFLFDVEGICVERIGECALTNCFMLETVELPKKIYRLDRYCFYRCLSLQEINLNYLKSIGASAFCQCESLVFISLDQIISIEENAFLGCLKLKKVSFGKHLKTIGKCAFCQCVSLVQISLPASVEKISDDSFSLCFNLKYVYYAGTKQQWQSIVSSSAFSSSYDITIYCVDGNIVIRTSQKYIRFLN